MPCPLGEAKASWSKVITWPPAFRILRRAPLVTLRAQIYGKTKEHKDYVRNCFYIITQKPNYILLEEKKLTGNFLPWAWGGPESWHHQWLFPQQQRFCCHGRASSSYGSNCNGSNVSSSACIIKSEQLKAGLNWQGSDTFNSLPGDYMNIIRSAVNFLTSFPTFYMALLTTHKT